MNNGFTIYPTNKKQLKYIQPKKQETLVSKSDEIAPKVLSQNMELEETGNIFNDDDLISSMELENQKKLYTNSYSDRNNSQQYNNSQQFSMRKSNFDQNGVQKVRFEEEVQVIKSQENNNNIF